MKILKRNGKTENIKFDKIIARIKKQTYGLDNKFIEPVEVAQKVISGLYDGVSAKEVDTLAAETAAWMTIKHPDYSILASRIAIISLYHASYDEADVPVCHRRRYHPELFDVHSHVHPNRWRAGEFD